MSIDARSISAAGSLPRFHRLLRLSNQVITSWSFTSEVINGGLVKK
jgi:hypothetical protein